MCFSLLVYSGRYHGYRVWYCIAYDFSGTKSFLRPAYSKTLHCAFQVLAALGGIRAGPVYTEPGNREPSQWLHAGRRRGSPNEILLLVLRGLGLGGFIEVRW